MFVESKFEKYFPKVHTLLDQAIEEGVSYGLLRAQKHEEWELTEEQRRKIHEAVSYHVSLYFYEYFETENNTLRSIQYESKHDKRRMTRYLCPSNYRPSWGWLRKQGKFTQTI